MKLRYDLNVTQRCNTVCRWCTRLVGVISVPDSDMTTDQAGRMLQAVTDTGHTAYRVKLSGGEPIENPEMTKIAEVFSNSPDLQRGFVLTNSTERKRRLATKLPPKFKWWRSPLDSKDWRHTPFLISPVDAGVSHKAIPIDKPCSTQKRCGLGFDPWGFAMCNLAGGLGRLLGINPYSDKPVTNRRSDICRHCIRSLPEEEQDKLHRRFSSGELTYPSPTFRRALRQWRDGKRTEFARF